MCFQHGERDIKMKDFDEKLMQTCEFLKDVTEKRAKCLQAFVDCENLVQWLKQSMKTCEFSGLVGHLCYPVFIIKLVTSQSPC